MKNILKGFVSFFDWMIPRTFEEQLNDLDNSMQRLYDRMDWGKYSSNSNCITHSDVDKLFEIQQPFCHNSLIKDPARSRKNKYYTRQQW